MARLFASGAMLVAMLGGADAHVRFAADYSTAPYLNNPSLGIKRGGPIYMPPAPTYRAPVARPPLYPPSQHAVPPVFVPAPGRELAAPPPGEPRREYVVPAAQIVAAAPMPADSHSTLLMTVLYLFGWGCVLIGGGNLMLGKWRARQSGQLARTTSGVAMEVAHIGASAGARTGIPSPEAWARRAGRVRNPVSGFAFRFQARANARALEEEQKRIKKARDMTKEYSGMLKDLVEGEEAATAYAIRRELAGEFYERERLKQEEQFEEIAHRRQLSGKRQAKELTEADTRRIEAAHEQEALERFKEPKFAAGLARFEEKQKGYLVGSASAEAAIAETRVPAKPQTGNENAEVVQLYQLLQSAISAIEEGERVGRDTQALRERVELYKKLLNLS